MDCQQLEISFTKNNANLFKLIDKTHHQCIKWVFILPNLEYNNVIAHNQYDFTFKHTQKDTNKISFVYSAYNQSNALANYFQFLCQLHALSLARWNHRFKCYFVRHFLSIACSSCVRFDFSLIFFCVCVYILHYRIKIDSFLFNKAHRMIDGQNITYNQWTCFLTRCVSSILILLLFFSILMVSNTSKWFLCDGNDLSFDRRHFL